MNIYFREEYFTKSLIEELSPLTEKSWAEANCAPGTQYEPDWEKYTELNDMNILRLFTVRTESDSDLVGYATFIVSPTLHSMGLLHALHDSMYILKPNRKNGTVKSLIEYIEKELIIDGVDTMIISVMTHRDFSNTLKGLGYTHKESSYSRRLL